MAKRLDLKDVNIYFGSFQAVADVSLSVLPRSVTAFIGPSGCGKTTVLRTLNRMHEVIPGARMQGSVLLDDDNTGTLVENGPTVDVFQSPTDPRTLAYVTGAIG